ncbi:uncharacterized protein LOC103509637 [Diaphorina citri]|uniref:Uncharacterized protein LOC103509637 n=1 Tax=Diaphorina citri TaxID=121845 RepID=A0A1S3D384_DIACI|nr:uncharacterized protein LOC103509637 [Diaphorina citri]
MPTRLPSILIALLLAWWVSPGQSTDETLATTKDPDRYLNYSTLAPLTEPETIHFDVDNFVDAILKANKKNIVYKINDQLNNFYDNQTTFVHRCASTQFQQIIEANKETRIDKMKSYVEYFFLYKQIYMELLNGYKNIIMENLTKLIKHDLRENYRRK